MGERRETWITAAVVAIAALLVVCAGFAFLALFGFNVPLVPG